MLVIVTAVLCVYTQICTGQPANPGDSAPVETNVSGQAMDAQLFHILPDRSLLRVFIGRGGLLARLGHNHVVVSRTITGSVFIADAPTRSHASMIIPVKELVVDDPVERARAGAEYKSTPSESDKAATRTNMLKVDVLNGEQYPEIHIDINAIDLNTNPGRFSVVITFKGRQIPLQLPANLSVDGNNLVVDSSFNLDHKDLGLRPFSAVGGALRVAETLGFELHIEADAGTR